MKIGIDIDDTITDSYIDILRRISNWYNVDYEYLKQKSYSYEYFKLNYQDFEDFEKKNFDDFIGKVKLKNNVVRVLNKLHEKNEIIFITARCNEEYSNPYRISKEYLDKNLVPYDSLNVGIKNKGEFCYKNNIDLFIDDNVFNCESALYYKINTLLFDAPFNQESKLKRIKDWTELENL